MNKGGASLARSVALLSICALRAVPAVSAECDVGSDDKAPQAEQKVVLLEQLVGDTGSVQKILQSDQTDAVASIEAAREAAALARQNLEAGCAGTAAEIATAGLNRASQALWLLQNRVAVGQQEYEALHSRTITYLQMLEAEPLESQGVGASDLAGIRRQLDRAEVLAVNAQYGEAIVLLEPIGDRLERRLVVIREQQAAADEPEPGRPDDEYARLSEQYRAYLLLLQQLAGARQLPTSSRPSYDAALQDASRLSESAGQFAANEDWPAALTSMREALQQCQLAVRLFGVTN